MKYAKSDFLFKPKFFLPDLNFLSRDKLMLHIKYLFQSFGLFVFPLSSKLSFTLHILEM